MNMFRNRFIKENARVSLSDKKTIPSTHNNFKSSSQSKGLKSLRCKYCYNIGHTDNNCRKKEMKQPPSMPEWVNKAICRKCKKKGHLSFNCPPKYDNKPFKSKNSNKKNSVHFKESAVCVSEFAGSTIHTQIDRLQHNLDQSKLYTCYKGNTHHHNACPSFKIKHKKNPFSTP